MTFRVLLAALLLLFTVTPPLVPQTPPATGGLDALVAEIEKALSASSPETYLRFVAAADRERAAQFVEDQFRPGFTRVVARLRDQLPLRGTAAGQGYRAMLDVFTETGRRGRIASWSLDVRRRPGTDGRSADAWQIVDQEELSNVDGLYRLELDAARQYTARDLTITAEDLTLTLARGSVFMADTDEGVTAMVLIGDGEVVFSPKPEAERGQVKIFSGRETLRTPIRRAFIRINEYEFLERLSKDALVERPVDARDLKRASETFAEFVLRSFALELGDLSPGNWSLPPRPGDFVAELDTRRYGILTYARSAGEAEDVTLFDRRREKNIALYASETKMAERGFYYDESDLVDYDIDNYSVDITFEPARQWIEGRARLTLRPRLYALSTLTLRLAESLKVESVTSDELGRLMHLRVRDQDQVLISLGSSISRDSALSLEVVYRGRLEPQELDREAVLLQEPQYAYDLPLLAAEPRYMYSNRSYWYPQSVVSDFATAAISIAVPADFRCVATGRPASNSPIPLEDVPAPYRRFEFRADQPTRYLSFVVSRMVRTVSESIPLENKAAAGGLSDGSRNAYVSGRVFDEVALSIEANPRQTSRARNLTPTIQEIVQFYTSVVGDYPYPSFTLALTESTLPGGHSPAHFAVLNQPVPGSPLFWRNDPVSFDGYPAFFLAHEVAHQWWGQAIGWKNYHEQWISEGFAQYFAALYGRRSRGDGTFDNILRQMRRSAIEDSDQGPVYLGYRLGHIQSEGRVFRAIVYNKAAMVLHMLRLFIGDDAFFRGVRRFYGDWRFRKAGTDDVRRAFEAESQQPLERYFQGWIHDARIPRLHFRYSLDRTAATENGQGAEAVAVLRFEQEGEPFHLPVCITLNYAAGNSQTLVARVTDRVTQVRVPLKADLRGVDINRETCSLAYVQR